jgi:predicted metalloendopeptidase
MTRLTDERLAEYREYAEHRAFMSDGETHMLRLLIAHIDAQQESINELKFMLGCCREEAQTKINALEAERAEMTEEWASAWLNPTTGADIGNPRLI